MFSFCTMQYFPIVTFAHHFRFVRDSGNNLLFCYLMNVLVAPFILYFIVSFTRQFSIENRASKNKLFIATEVEMVLF